MEALLYFALWGGLIFLMMRFGCGAHVMGRGGRNTEDAAAAAGGTGANPRWVAPPEDVDPVCGKTVATASAKSTVHDGWVYYFCSADCRERFEGAPELYLPDRQAGQRPQLEHGHD